MGAGVPIMGRYGGHPAHTREGAQGRRAIWADLRAATWRQEALLSTSRRTRGGCAQSEAGGEGGEHSWRQRLVHKKGALPCRDSCLPVEPPSQGP